MVIDSKGRIVITGYRDTTVLEERDEKEGSKRDLLVMRLDPGIEGAAGGVTQR
jgi:hypothetical protein